MYLSSYLNNMEGSSNLNNLNNLSNSYDDYNNSFDDNLILNGVRSRKKNIENPCCPVCSCTIRNNELENHFSIEIERLNKISGNIGTKRKLSNGCSNQLNMMSMPGSSSASQSQVPEEADVDVTGCVGSEVFQRVRQNRQRRLRTRARTRLTSTSDSTGECPVCSRRLPRRRLQRHALRCLRKTGGALPGDDDDELLETSSSEEGSIDVEGDDPMDAAEQPGSSFGAEYQWCGQWRVRAAALQAIEAPLPSPHTSALRRASNDTTLVVDGDEDTELYGPPQYSPSRIAPDSEETPSTSRDQQYVNSTHSGTNERELATKYGVSGINDGSPVNNVERLGINDGQLGNNDGVMGVNDGQSGNDGRSGTDDRGLGIDDGGVKINDGQWQSADERGSAINDVQLGHVENGSGSNQRGFGNNGMEFGLNLSVRSPSGSLETKGRGMHAAAAQVRISALMSRVRELEERQESGNEVKCLICLGPYVSPAVSIQCWHVHCETCWMDALKAKKICPQCNAITTTQHLRRVYM